MTRRVEIDLALERADGRCSRDRVEDRNDMDTNDRDFSYVRTQRRDGVSATESVKTVAVARQRMYRAQRLPSRPVAHNSGAAGWASVGRRRRHAIGTDASRAPGGRHA